MALLTPHTKGVASLGHGEFEYMMMRRINGTDDQGPWPLNDTTPLHAPMGIMLAAASGVPRPSAEPAPAMS